MENKRIVKLSKETSNKIAAGEVVERPVSIIKELVENAIDAEASFIIIEIKKGGKSYIRVTDDGIGIFPEDVETAFERHATSKIKKAEDIEHISSLGFRGEALSSIAAVSHTEIITKTRFNQTGIQLKISGGMVTDKKEIGCSDGTTIVVSDLFYNVPARYKFLKQDATESNLIIDFVSKISLAFPNIRFRLINNGKILFSTNGQGDAYKTIISIYNKDISDNLIKVTAQNKDYQLDAFISPPSDTRPSKKHQIFFVNGRYIKSQLLDKILNKSYKERIPEGRYPIGFVFLKISPEKIDVNIHPNKREIRFKDEQGLEAFGFEVIENHLKSVLSIPKIKTDHLFQEEKVEKPAKEEEQVNIKTLLTTNDLSEEKVLQHPTHIHEEKVTPEYFQNNEWIEEQEPLIIEHEEAFDIQTLNILGIIFTTYIAVSDSNNFYLIDQHAAHERILYEQLLREYLNKNTASQRLLNPYLLELSVSDAQRTIENIDFIRSFGFEIDPFGNNAFVIKGIPSMIELTESKKLLEEIIDNMTEGLIDKYTMEKIIGKACKKAVKAHDHLNIKEIEHLLKLLNQTKNPYSCPHGRPVFIKLSESDIEKMFKRT